MSSQKRVVKTGRPLKGSSEKQSSGHFPITMTAEDKLEFDAIAESLGLSKSSLGRLIIVKWKTIYRKNSEAAMKFIFENPEQ